MVTDYGNKKTLSKEIRWKIPTPPIIGETFCWLQPGISPIARRRREAFVSFVKIDATVATVETSLSRKVFDNRQGRQLVLTLERRARSTVRRGALRSEMIHQIHQNHRVH
jgi:hypothetical protein